MSSSGRYEVRIETEARKYLSALDKLNRERISRKINELASNPRPAGYKKLKGQSDDFYRIRCGNYRVIYVIRDQVLT